MTRSFDGAQQTGISHGDANTVVTHVPLLA